MVNKMASLMEFLQAALLLILPPAIGFALRYLAQMANVRLEQADKEDLRAAAMQGANIAYGYLVKHRTTIADPMAAEAAVVTGAQYVRNSVPGQIERVGKDLRGVQQMVEARLAGLVAADPAVTVAPVEALASVKTFNSTM